MTKVFVAHYSHKYDDDYRVFSTAEKANEWRQNLAEEWWESELDKPLPKDKTPEEIADLYFGEMGERMSNNEYFHVEELEVE